MATWRAWIEDNLGWGPIFGILLVLISIGYLLTCLRLPSLSFGSAPIMLGVKLGLPLTFFGFALLWVIYPLMSRGPLRVEPRAHRAAYLGVAFGLAIIFLTVLVALLSSLIH